MLLAALAPLFFALDGGFVYDDHALVELREDGAAPHDLAAALLGDLFGLDEDGRPASGYYRPVVQLSYFVEGRLHGSSPLGFRVTNLAIAACCSLLLLSLLRALPGLAPVSCAAALLFSAHPVHAESLALISGRTDPLLLIFLLLAALALCRGAWRRALLWFALGLGAKESAPAFLPLLLAVPFAAGAGARQEARRVAIRFGMGALALTAAFFLVKHLALGIVAPPAAYTGAGGVAARLLTFVAVLPRYLALTFWPAGLSVIHEVELVTGAGDPRLWAGVATLFLLLGLLRARALPLRAGAAIYLLGLLPASNLVPITYAYREAPFPFFERYLFVPSAGAALAVAHLLRGRAARGARAGSVRPSAARQVALLLLLVLPMQVRYALRAAEFRSDTALYEAALARAEEKLPVLLILADARLRELDAWGALATYERALRLDPDSARARLGRGQTLAILAQHQLMSAAGHDERGLPEQGRRIRGEAWKLLAEARAAVEPMLLDATSGGAALELFGTVAGLEGRHEEAADYYRRAFEAGGASPALAANYQKVAYELRDAAKRLGDEGIQSARRAVARVEEGVRALTGAWPPRRLAEPIRETVLKMMCERADILFLTHDFAAARAAFEEVLLLDGDLARCEEGLGAIAKQQGRRAAAYRHFERALRLDPDAFVALTEMVTMLQEDGRAAEARSYFDRLQRVMQEGVVRPPGAEPAGTRRP